MQKVWEIAQTTAEVSVPENVPENLHPVARRMLARRGILTAQEIEAFLNPSWGNGVHDPFLFANMQACVERIFKAIADGEHIVIHGDYDADGVCGSVLLAETIKMLVKAEIPLNLPLSRETSETRETSESESPLVKGDLGDFRSEDKFFPVLTNEHDGIALDIYIPHREKEGYGLNLDSVNMIVERGTNLLITVDCGIANVDEIRAARERNVDVIVVDHHQFGEVLPDAILIHPKLPGEKYPFKDLAAVGVAWKVACGLVEAARIQGKDVPAGYDKWLLDLVSIATVTDIVPLKGENRVLETYGLIVLNKMRRPGLKALIDVASWRRGALDSETVGFVIGPRINAAGRMEHAFQAVDLLLEEDLVQAIAKANALEAVNKSRQKATEALMQQAETMITDHESQMLLIAWCGDWSPSLVGLAAGRYADRLGKPAVFIGRHGDSWVGSGRSIPSYDITAAVREAGNGYLSRHGGHMQACGFTVMAEDRIEPFAKALREHAANALRGTELLPRLDIETELKLDDLNDSLVDTLVKFEPFGEGNPRPAFVTTKLTVVEKNMVGAAQNHVRCVLQDSTGRKQKFMGFYRKDLAEIMTSGAAIDVVYEVSSSIFNGRREIQCKLEDAKPSNS